MLLGKGVMINWTNVVPADRPAYDAWQCREHMPGRVAIPGFLRGRRYIEAFPLSFPGPAHREFLTLYEVNDLSVLTGADYLAKANSPSPLTLKTTPVVRDSIRGLSHVRASLGEGMGGAALTLRFDPRMLSRIKRVARRRYLNYQSMIKQWLSERMENELKD